MRRPAKPSDELLTSGDTPPHTVPTIERVAEGEVTISVTGEDQIKHLYGTRTEDAANLLFKSAINALGRNADEYFELMPAMAVERKPRDAVDAMLVTQMTATHMAMTEISQKLQHAPSPQTAEAYERSMTRLNRTFFSQMEGLKKYRAKAQQIVRVERVEVRDGGPATASVFTARTPPPHAIIGVACGGSTLQQRPRRSIDKQRPRRSIDKRLPFDLNRLGIPFLAKR